jgi:hypothetical protein
MWTMSLDTVAFKSLKKPFMFIRQFLVFILKLRPKVIYKIGPSGNSSWPKTTCLYGWTYGGEDFFTTVATDVCTYVHISIGRR